MKNIIITIFLLTVSLTTFANTVNPIKDLNNEIKNGKNINRIVISFDSNKQLFEFNFSSAPELFNFNLKSIKNLFLITDKCIGNATITVTVSVGVGSTYASASATIKVPCDEVIAETIKLKNQLKKALG